VENGSPSSTSVPNGKLIIDHYLAGGAEKRDGVSFRQRFQSPYLPPDNPTHSKLWETLKLDEREPIIVVGADDLGRTDA
jgi:hypothetical protein